jgi:hypothetical protein
MRNTKGAQITASVGPLRYKFGMLRWVWWVEVWVKKFGGGGVQELICTAKRRSNQSPTSWFVILDLKSGASVRATPRD